MARVSFYLAFAMMPFGSFARIRRPYLAGASMAHMKLNRLVKQSNRAADDLAAVSRCGSVFVQRSVHCAAMLTRHRGLSFTDVLTTHKVSLRYV